MRVALLGLLGGCATAGMGHGVSHEEIMRQGQMMEQGQSAQQATQQSMTCGMSREEMVRHCEMMRQRQGAPPPAQPPPDPHQH